MSNKLIGCRRGTAAVEFALCLPLFVILLVGIVEVARALSQASAVEKGLRAGAAFVARANLPLDSAAIQAAKNQVKRGSLNANAAYLAPGWAENGATVTITRLPDYVTGGVMVPVFRVSATIPFVPMIPGLPNFTMTRDYEQVHVGQ